MRSHSRKLSAQGAKPRCSLCKAACALLATDIFLWRALAAGRSAPPPFAS